MADLPQRARNSVELQREVFRLAEAEHGLSVTVLARTRKIPLSTLRSWRTGTQMPLWAIGELDLPDDLASLLLAPWQKHVGTNDPGDEDFDALGLEALGLAGEVAAARSPHSPGGTAIVHTEVAQIKARARRITPKLRAVA